MPVDPEGAVKARGEATRAVQAGLSRSGTSARLNLLIDLPTGQWSLRVGAASHALARIGTVQLPVSIPSESDKRLQIVGFAVGDAPSSVELARGGPRFWPSLDLSFPSGAAVRCMATLLWGGNANQINVSVSDGSGEGTKALALSGTRGAAGLWTAVVDLTLPLTKYGQERRNLTLKVDTEDGQHATATIPIRVGKHS